MSTANKNESVLLAVTEADNAITIRIDRNSLAQSQYEGFPVAELKLINCHDRVQVLDTLNHSIDKPISYEVVKENDRVTVALWINYAVDELEVDCSQIHESFTDYTLGDWKRKTSRLAQLYAESTESNELGHYLYRLLKNSLSKMIQKEYDLYQHKIEFFTQTNPEKAAALTGQMQAYHKVLALVGLGEVDGKAMAQQIRESILEIWSDTIWEQAAYAALVENRIADLGKAAIFPLLEIAKDSHHESVRKEAILILGLIDPKVQEEVLRIVQLDNKAAS